MIISLNTSKANMKILNENINSILKQHNQHNQSKKKNIEIFNLLKNNEVEITNMSSNGNNDIKIYNNNILVIIDEEIFNKNVKDQISKAFVDNASINNNFAENIGRILINHFISVVNENVYTKNIYNICVYNDKLHKEEKNKIIIFEFSDKYFSTKEGDNCKLSSEKPDNGKYSEFNHHLELHIHYKHNK